MSCEEADLSHSIHTISDFEYWWSLPGDWVEPPNERRGGWSGVVRAEVNGRILYIKRQLNHLYRNLRHPFGHPTVSREWHYLCALESLGIPAPRPVFHQARRTRGGVEAVLATEALDGYRAMSEFGSLPTEQRVLLARKLGTLLGRLHRARLQHSCLYDKHVMIRPNGEGELDVALLDLEKMRPRLTRNRAARHDLSQLRRRQSLLDDQDWRVLMEAHARQIDSV
ncbi:InaA protein [Pseudothauera nasutitermitis]|uniref:InaA protein n=1 Tax=Pseudothauera nasutitermitis TaxID=2565930 RepID=A0A4S4AUE3_9RHOO|nr:lipopolysaccharide kinase InaA family protein [Pseudothauera nasutitermitis]THF63567.1 InaA protein [Pseudothauera nasutitermitis]